MGAPVAVEMALQLEAAGEPVAMLVLLDPRFRQPDGLRHREWRARRNVAQAWERTRGYSALAWRRARERQLAQAAGRRLRATLSASSDSVGIAKSLARIREDYRVEPFDVPAAVVVSEEFCRTMVPRWHLEEVVHRPHSWTELPGPHGRLLLPPNVDAVAAEITAALDAAVGSPAVA
jgi:thioesterase domain-containing protein